MIIPILENRKLKHRQVKKFAKGHLQVKEWGVKSRFMTTFLDDSIYL